MKTSSDLSRGWTRTRSSTALSIRRTRSASGGGSALAYGAGLGVKIGEVVKVELEYTGTTGDNELDLITLGGLVLF